MLSILRRISGLRLPVAPQAFGRYGKAALVRHPGPFRHWGAVYFFTAFEDCCDLVAILQNTNIVERIAVDQQDVAVTAELQSANVIVPADSLGVFRVIARMASIGVRPKSVTKSSISRACHSP